MGCKPCEAGSAKAATQWEIRYSDGTTATRATIAQARIAAAKDPAATIHQVPK